MASPSETTLIVLSSAVAARLIAADTAAFWQIVTALGLTVTPFLAKLGRLAGSKVGVQETAGEIDEAVDLPPSDKSSSLDRPCRPRGGRYA